MNLNIVIRFPPWVYPTLHCLGWLVRLGLVSEDRATVWAARIGAYAGSRMIR